jgi:hypothetical protein
MKPEEFEALLFIEVADRAATEPPPEHGKPKHYGRPWTQLRDEMVASGAKTVHELSSSRILVFYQLTRPANGGALSSLRRFFGGASAS